MSVSSANAFNSNNEDSKLLANESAVRMPMERCAVNMGQQVDGASGRQRTALVNHAGLSLADDHFVQNVELIPESDGDSDAGERQALRDSGHFVLLTKEQ